MTGNSAIPFEHNRDKELNLLSEVSNLERQLRVLIHSKGLLHYDVKDLYHKICSIYERIILDDYVLAKLQDVEYSLWKLHYKHIDEFRKRIKRSSANGESTKMVMTQNATAMQRNDENHLTGFESFLSDATEFYQNLVVKMRKSYGLPEESSVYRKGSSYNSIEPKKAQKCQFLCHRFLICLGDIVRYRKQYERPEVHFHNWSAAATNYLEASIIWPDSGNPHNQLAVLATYVGDEFLALYHCVRSLAVQEPFPDAQGNLILLFERNTASHLSSISRKVHFDFLKPTEKSSLLNKSQTDAEFSVGVTSESEEINTFETNIWPLIIRMISFFFLKFSMDDFLCTCASTMMCLDALMELDDSKLKTTLESYQLIDSLKTGPFRAIQVVSVFIFMLQYLFEKSATKETKDMDMNMALAGTFVFMGRLVDRCLKSNHLQICPLLPAVLVFVEWLGSMMDEAERHGVDEKSQRSMSYFFDVFIDLLKNLSDEAESESESLPLWEDYELRGFTPVAFSHELLDFSNHWAHIDSFEGGARYRTSRIINAASKISNRSKTSRIQVFSDKLGRKRFYKSETNEIPDKKQSEKVMSNVTDLFIDESKHINESTEDCENGKSVAAEEEEVILFKPLTRYNSVPIYTSAGEDGLVHPTNAVDQTVQSDECLRRATSLLLAQNQNQNNSFTFHTDITNFRRSKPFKQQEQPLVKDAGAYHFPETPLTAGPPSLSGWVIDSGSSSIDVEKAIDKSFIEHSLNPIEEISPTSAEADEYYSSHSYSAPVPSAPLLPDEALWFDGVRYPTFSDCTDTFTAASASQGSCYPNWTATHPPLSLPPRQMTSSEWLRRYREKYNIDPVNNHIWPVVPSLASGNRDVPRFDHMDRWEYPMAPDPTVYRENGEDENRIDTLFPNYQRPSSTYRCGTVTDQRNEQLLLLQYLKEREWKLQVQRDAALRGPAYFGN